MFVKDVIELYLNSSAFLEDIRSDRTRADYQKNLQIFAKIFQNYSARKMNADCFTDEVEHFLKSMQDTPRKAEYCLTTIRAMFNWAVRKRLLKNNPVKYVRFKRPAKKTPVRIWNDELIDFVVEKFPKPLKEYVIFATETGLRNCDLIRLKKSEHFILKEKHIISKLFKVKQRKWLRSDALISY